MRKIMILTSLVLAASLAKGTAMAQTRYDASRYQDVQYVAAPVFTDSCEVNGVVYGVDAYSRIWAQNAVGGWFVIGRILAVPNGYIAIRNDGVRYPAVCQ
jgi:hypothetical protein